MLESFEESAAVFRKSERVPQTFRAENQAGGQLFHQDLLLCLISTPLKEIMMIIKTFMLVLLASVALLARAEGEDRELSRAQLQASSRLRPVVSAVAPAAKVNAKPAQLGLLPSCSEDQHDAISWMCKLEFSES